MSSVFGQCAQVYKVQCSDGVVRASKEVSLRGFDDGQLQTVFLRCVTQSTRVACHEMCKGNPVRLKFGMLGYRARA
jgi:hypothetical protein